MPTYEYKCKKCGHIFEVFHSMSSEPVKECPKCGGAVKKLISAGSTPIFKGSGFYQTDYKNKSSNVKKTETKGTKPIKTEPKAGSTAKSE